MRGPYRRFSSSTTFARWRALVLIVAAGMALLPLPANQARGAGPGVRLDWGTKARMPTARQTFGLAAAQDGTLYAVGGTDGSFAGTVTATEAYDPATNTWTTKAPLPSPRAALGLAVAPNGRLYAVGGLDGNGTAVGTVEEYDPATNTWTGRAALHDPRFALALAAAPNGKLYAAGGSNSSSARGTLEEYDPATDTWAVKSPMTTARYALAMTAAPNGKLYAVGGSTGTVIATVEEYDPATDTWRPRSSMQTARFYLSLTTASNGKLYAVGGSGGAGGGCVVCAFVEEYEPSFNAWTLRAPMPTARSGLGLATAPNGRLYAVGGVESARLSTLVEEYDPQTNTWAGAKTTPLPQGRLFPASAVAGGKLYVFGGIDSQNPLDSVIQYDPATTTWTPMANMPTARYAAAAVTAGNGKIYVVGGARTDALCPGGTCTTVEEFTPPPQGGSLGSWHGAANGISQLPVPRALAAMALGADAKLYLTGGSDGSIRRVETFQYDPAINSGWLPMASMHNPRASHGLAPAGDGRLYAVGGDQPAGVVATVERFVLPNRRLAGGGWEGPDGIAPLPAARTALGLVGLPNGGLVAAGGNDASFPPSPRPDVYEYDPAANAWAPRPPLPTARFGLSLAPLGTRQLLAVGGSAGGAPLTAVEEGDRDELPSVSAGGPYTVQAGGRVQLSATGSDPEGDSLGFAWDLDGSLRYATPGQTVTFSTAGLAPGAQTVRMRALDPLGGYALASTTVTITAPPTACNPRPNVAVATTRAGTGQIQAVITAQTSPATPSNSLQRIAITRIDNATVLLNGSPVTAGAGVTLPAGTSQATLLVQRQHPGAASMVSFVATDLCGDWRSFVGGGAGAF